jgi:membrane protein required for colicin V production
MDGVAITDIVALIVVVLSALLAFARGFSKEVLSLLGWVGAILITVFLYPYVEPYAHDLISHKWLARIATGVGIFIIAMIVLSIFSNFISESIQESSMGGIDRALGILFGVARAWVLLAVLYIGVSIFYEKEKDIPQDIREAKTTPAIVMGAEIIWSLLPKRLRQDAGSAANSVKGATKENVLQKSFESLANQKRGAAQKQKDFEKLNNPRPSSGKAPENKDPGGYDKKDRTGLEKLMERTVK